MSFLTEVDKGRLGKNKGLPIPINTLHDVINGTQKGRYILVGAESGIIYKKRYIITMCHLIR